MSGSSARLSISKIVGVRHALDRSQGGTQPSSRESAFDSNETVAAQARQVLHPLGVLAGDGKSRMATGRRAQIAHRRGKLARTLRGQIENSWPAMICPRPDAGLIGNQLEACRTSSGFIWKLLCVLIVGNMKFRINRAPADLLFHRNGQIWPTSTDHGPFIRNWLKNL